jgi:hypothetical protein
LILLHLGLGHFEVTFLKNVNIMERIPRQPAYLASPAAAFFFILRYRK